VRGEMGHTSRRVAVPPLDGEGDSAAGVEPEVETETTATTEALDLVGRWVALLDEAEALLAAALADSEHPAASHLYRAASQALDTLYASEHAMTSDARRGVREYV
jgi:hypothetical protein